MTHGIWLYGCVAIGGAIGAMLRFSIVQLTANVLGKGFPFGTLTVNVIGSFALGAVYCLLQHQDAETSPIRAFLAIGLLGALTTFSTFSLDTLMLLNQGLFFKAFLNIFLNVVVCVVAVWLACLLFKG